MPCMDGGPSHEQVEREKRDKQTVYRLACERCEWYEQTGDWVPQWAQEWWEFHKAEEAARRYREIEELRREGLRATGLGKLSLEEIEALGLSL